MDCPVYVRICWLKAAKKERLISADLLNVDSLMMETAARVSSSMATGIPFNSTSTVQGLVL